MAHQLLLVKKDKTFDVSPLVGTIGWGSSIEELGQSLTFDVAFNDSKVFPVNPCDIGDMVVLRNKGAEIYRGVIITEGRSGRAPLSYTSFDFAFYLNKSTAVYQFNKVSAGQAIAKILGDFGVPVGRLANMPTMIKKVFINVVVSEIIRDILASVEADQGHKLRMEMRAGKLYIEKQADLVVKGTFVLARGINERDVMTAISGASRTRSIEEMKNSIKLVLSKSDDQYSIAASAEDATLITRYGLLQLTETIDEKDIAQARNIARNRLKEFGRVLEDNSLELIGDDRIRAGRLIVVDEPLTGMKGKYLIKSVSHSVKGGTHTMSLGLGVVD
ncbi:XkdQ/YqbQ family protein [Cohnella cholangitidis]|uniref:YqbQ/XkdQ domain-containing protein n=1 Tax=Cohnella cholangitidis TaxID=2598458 RepID=A0A7G5C3G2_9BACL|nr:hypothetical protein [Cohnella cholangitidis]QMV43746.1 hypothetical protein FPL14_23160 [Cohnella cholangitidis]